MSMVAKDNHHDGDGVSSCSSSCDAPVGSLGCAESSFQTYMSLVARLNALRQEMHETLKNVCRDPWFFAVQQNSVV